MNYDTICLEKTVEFTFNNDKDFRISKIRQQTNIYRSFSAKRQKQEGTWNSYAKISRKIRTFLYFSHYLNDREHDPSAV